jgi:hypothetical protein
MVCRYGLHGDEGDRTISSYRENINKDVTEKHLISPVLNLADPCLAANVCYYCNEPKINEKILVLLLR